MAQSENVVTLRQRQWPTKCNQPTYHGAWRTGSQDRGHKVLEPFARSDVCRHMAHCSTGRQRNL